MSSHEHFTTRWGLILSVLGIAVGTGNIWRFPRIAATNGGGTFLLPWVVFLFVWSIPLIMTEFAIGKKTRQGTVGAFSKMMGSRFAWMGAFVGFVATAIMFYYSVVSGWCLRYFSLAATGQLLGVPDHSAFWEEFVNTGWKPVLFHVIAITIGVAIVRKGIVNGIERANRILIPALLLLIVVSALRAVTLPGAVRGLEYLFTPNFEALTDASVWLNALTQNAWDTGAGWGLILTYAVYMKQREDVPLNAALIGLGNNSVSILAGITIFSTVFAMVPERAAGIIQETGPANTGLTFIWIPQLFAEMSGGTAFCAFFFMALTFAAISSLISMIELTTRILMDLGCGRGTALKVVYGVTLLMGLPSALSLDFFLNQDWTWGVGLLLSGFFIAILAIRHGVDRFRRDLINSEGRDIKVGRWYNLIIQFAIPAQVVILVSWWFSQVIRAEPDTWWNPISVGSVGTCIVQWFGVIVVFLLLNRFLAVRSLRH